MVPLSPTPNRCQVAGDAGDNPPGRRGSCLSPDHVRCIVSVLPPSSSTRLCIGALGGHVFPERLVHHAFTRVRVTEDRCLCPSSRWMCSALQAAMTMCMCALRASDGVAATRVA